jgi:hypothetical protein
VFRNHRDWRLWRRQTTNQAASEFVWNADQQFWVFLGVHGQNYSAYCVFWGSHHCKCYLNPKLRINALVFDTITISSIIVPLFSC